MKYNIFIWANTSANLVLILDFIEFLFLKSHIGCMSSSILNIIANVLINLTISH